MASTLHTRASTSSNPIDERSQAKPPQIRVREPLRPATGTPQSQRRIRIQHPDYYDSDNDLLELLVPDHPNGGLQYDFLMVACGIIANNRWDGWLTETVDGPRLSFHPNDILTNEVYYFHLPNSSRENPYPVVPTFRDWKFPHNNLPPSWAALPRRADTDRDNPAGATISGFLPSLKMRDYSCRISACVESAQAAHICPRSEEQWYIDNRMRPYQERPMRSIDDMANGMLLRADLHIAFDAMKFVFYPKYKNAEEGDITQGAEGENKPVLVTHIMVPSNELHLLYHNVPLQPIPKVSREYLFARFAWTIFPLVGDFFDGGVKRAVTGVRASERWIDGEGSWLDALQCQLLVMKPSKSPKKSESPPKRMRSDAGDGYGGGDTGSVVVAEDERPSKRRAIGRESFESLSRDVSTAPRTPYNEDIDVEADDGDDDEEAIERRLDRLRRQALKQERSHSDPEGRWEKEEEWAKYIRSGNVAMGPAETRRLYEFWGEDFEEADASGLDFPEDGEAGRDIVGEG